MGSNKNKLKRFAEMKSFANVFEPMLEDVKTGSYHLKGKWREEYFKNDNPIILELGCGKGEYTVGMAEKFLRRILLLLISRARECMLEQNILLRANFLTLLSFEHE